MPTLEEYFNEPHLSADDAAQSLLAEAYQEEETAWHHMDDTNLTAQQLEEWLRLTIDDRRKMTQQLREYALTLAQELPYVT